MRYKFYKADQFAPYWFSFGEVPQEVLTFFDVLQRNGIPYVVRGGFALAALLGSSNYQIKDIDLIVGRDDIKDLIEIDFVEWEPFFNKNSKGEDVYSLFYDKGSNTYLKFDVLFMDLLPVTCPPKTGPHRMLVVWAMKEAGYGHQTTHPRTDHLQAQRSRRCFGSRSASC